MNNAGYGNRKPFLSAAASVELRAEMDERIDQQVNEWYASVPAASHPESIARPLDPDGLVVMLDKTSAVPCSVKVRLHSGRTDVALASVL